MLSANTNVFVVVHVTVLAWEFTKVYSREILLIFREGIVIGIK